MNENNVTPAKKSGSWKKIVIMIFILVGLAVIALLIVMLLQRATQTEVPEDEYGRDIIAPILSPELDTVEDIGQYTQGKPIPPSIISGKTDPNIFMYYNTKEEHIRGDRSKNIALIEYADMRSRFAAIIHEELKGFFEKNKDTMHWAFRHYPFGNEDKDYLTGQASECVYLQLGDEKFWEFADLMFLEKTVTEDSLASAAKKLGANEDEFKNCLESDRTYNYVIEDEQRAVLFEGIEVTPSFTFYNRETGEMRIVDGINPISYYQKVLDAMLESGQ